MKNKNEEILASLFLSSEEAENLHNDQEIQSSVKKGMALLASYRKQATAEKAANFKKSLGNTGKQLTISIEDIKKLFDKLMNGGFGSELKDKGLGYCRNSKNKDLTDEEKRIILNELGLLDRPDE